MAKDSEAGHRQMSKSDSDEILAFLMGFMLDYGGDEGGRVTLKEPWYTNSPYGFNTMVDLGFCEETEFASWRITQAGLDYIERGGKDG